MARYLVTSALPYANGPLHLGHLAGAYIPADIFVRSRKLNGDDVIYICGTDEHGVPITIRADIEGITPQEVVDRYHHEIAQAFKAFRIDFDNFSGTARPLHTVLSQEFFLNLLNNNHILVKEEEQFYDDQAERFLPDRYVEGECPKCHYDKARGDQCDKCGVLLTPFELIDPRSALSGSKPIAKKAKHWYLKLQDFEDKIVSWLQSKNDWKDNVTRFILGWIRTEGLRERAITRSLSWGVPVPLDDLEAQDKVLYVWFEAPIGYISSTVEWAEKLGQPDLWKDYWHNPETKMVHFIGKDNIPFHAVIWPALLMGQHDDRWILPYDIPANEYLNLEGEKISTSQNWAVWAQEAVNDFPADTLRYALAANAPESKDADFSWKFFQSRNNDELANIYGNLVNRTLTFVHKEGGLVPEGVYNQRDQDHFLILEGLLTKLFDAFSHYRVREACKLMMDIAREGNRYFDEMKPWELRVSNSERLKTVLNVCLNTLGILAFASWSIVPDSAEKLWNMLGQTTNLAQERLDHITTNFLKPGQKLNASEILFRKIDDKEIDAQIEKLNMQAGRVMKQIPKIEAKPEITIDDFMKLDLRVAEIVHAEVPEKSKKLLKLKVKVGVEERQIMAGIKEFYAVEELMGKKIIIVFNLKPAKLAGEESQGMLLAASNDDKSILYLVDPGDVPSGSKVS